MIKESKLKILYSGVLTLVVFAGCTTQAFAEHRVRDLGENHQDSKQVRGGAIHKKTVDVQIPEETKNNVDKLEIPNLTNIPGLNKVELNKIENIKNESATDTATATSPVIEVIATTSTALTPMVVATDTATSTGTPTDIVNVLATSSATTSDYIVVFKKDSITSKKDKVKSDLKAKSRKVGKEFRHVKDGFVTNITNIEADDLKKNPDVEAVEKDRVVKLESVEGNATWGLDRIDQKNLPLDKSYSYGSDGSGVNVYILDTGINANHSEFVGRVGSGYDFIDNDSQPQDCNGHGTHVAGTIAGTTYGVAKKANIHSVRVLDCNGSGMLSQIIQGIDWVVANKSGPSVANMSLGSSNSPTLNSAVKNAVASGVVFAVAAGNSSADACGYSPASEPSAITVGSTNNSDTKSSFSNYGSCVDIFAPGENITSALYSNNTGTQQMSGTSMASPHVAGVAARYLSEFSSATPAQVDNGLKLWAKNGKVNSAGSASPNLLLGAPQETSSTTPVTNPGTTTPATSTPATSTPATTTPPTTNPSGVTVNMLVSKSSQYSGYYLLKGNLNLKDVNSAPLVGAKVTVKASGAINGTGSFVTNQRGDTGFSVYSQKAGQTNFVVSGVTDVSGKPLQFSGTITKTI